MRLLILGSTGRVGQLVLTEALGRGHSIFALVRKPGELSTLQQEHAGLTVIEGDPLDAAAVDDAFLRSNAGAKDPDLGQRAGRAQIDAVVIALNARRAADSPFAAVSPDTPPDMLARGARNALAAMTKHGARHTKIVVLSMMGVGSSSGALFWPVRLLFKHSNMRFQNADHKAMDLTVRAWAAERKAVGIGAGPDGRFVLVRPCMMVDGEVGEVRLFRDDGEDVKQMMPKISRRSVANFIVDAIESDKYNGRSPVITN